MCVCVRAGKGDLVPITIKDRNGALQTDKTKGTCPGRNNHVGVGQYSGVERSAVTRTSGTSQLRTAGCSGPLGRHVWSPQAHVSERRFRATRYPFWGFAISFCNVSDTGVFMSRKSGRGKEKEWRKRAEEEKLGGRESRRRKDEGKKDGEEGIKESRE